MRVKIPVKYIPFSVLALVSLVVAYAIFGTSVLSAESASGTTTLNFTIVQSISVTPSVALTDGIIFGTISPNTNYNPALNNTGCAATTSGCYNWTIDSTTSSNVAFFNKLAAAITCTGGTCAFTESGSNTYPGNTGFGTNTSFSTQYVNVSSCYNIAAGSFCYARYYINVSSGVTSGDYGGANKYGYCVNSTVGATAC